MPKKDYDFESLAALIGRRPRGRIRSFTHQIHPPRAQINPTPVTAPIFHFLSLGLFLFAYTFTQNKSPYAKRTAFDSRFSAKSNLLIQ